MSAQTPFVAVPHWVIDQCSPVEMMAYVALGRELYRGTTTTRKGCVEIIQSGADLGRTAAYGAVAKLCSIGALTDESGAWRLLIDDPNHSVRTGGQQPLLSAQADDSSAQADSVLYIEKDKKTLASPSEPETPPAAPPEPDGSAEFAEFWDVVPKRVGRGAAERSWRKAVEDGHDPDEIIRAMEMYARLVRAQGTERQFIVHPSTWLNQQRWLDEGVEDDIATVERRKLEPDDEWSF